MPIRIIDSEPDVSVTKDELRRYQDEYQRSYMFYAGTPPSLESFIRARKRNELPPEGNREGRISFCT